MLRVLLAAAAASAPQVVARVPGGVVAFAEDQAEVAWVDRAHVIGVARADGTQRRRSLEPIRGFAGGFAVLNGRALWVSRQRTSSGAYSECPYGTDRALRKQAQLDTRRKDCFSGDRVLLAAADGTIAYAPPATIEVPPLGRVVLDDFATSIATAGHRIAALLRDAYGTPQTFGADVSPDGSRIVVASLRDASSPDDIYILGRDGRVISRVHGSGAAPRWSPDGSSLAWGDGKSLVVARTDGSGARIVATYRKGIRGVAWSPDGARLAYVDGDGGVSTVTAGRVPDFLAPTSDSPTGIDWSPDGGTIYVASTGADGGIWAVSAATGKSRRIIEAAAFGVACSASGSEIAYGASGIHVAAADGTNDRVLTTGVSDSDPAWTPDGTTLLFSRATHAGQVDLWSVSASGGPAQLLAVTPAIVAARDAEVLTMSGRVIARFVQRTHGGAIALSRRAAVIRSGSTLTTYAVPSGRTLRTLHLPVGVTTISAAGTRVLFATRRAIYLVDARVGPPQIVAHPQSPPVGASIVGNRIAWAENRGRNAVILTLRVG
jgi:Tol biopolymer transport system component